MYVLGLRHYYRDMKEIHIMCITYYLLYWYAMKQIIIKVQVQSESGIAGIFKIYTYVYLILSTLSVVGSNICLDL